MNRRIGKMVFAAGCIGSTLLGVMPARGQSVAAQVGGNAATQPASGQALAGTGALTLSSAGNSERDGNWNISVQGPTGFPVTGKVQINGFAINQPGQLGKVDWRLSGKKLSGTILSPNGTDTFASFKGTVTATGVQGTFTAANGQSGSWSWTGDPSPSLLEALGTSQ